LLRTVAEIVRVVKVPVSVDSEAGFSRDPKQVASFVLKLVELGVVGINLEDGTEPADLLAAKIEAIKNAVSRAGVDVFVNARTDVLLKKLVPAEQAVSEVLARAELYARAGGDGLFAPLVTEPEAIRKLTDAVRLPVNLLAVPSLAPVAELRALGVRRLSAGSAIGQYALAAAQAVVQRFLADGQSSALFATPGALPNMNALLKRP
jgi:2-methylisocitrate lyase-like PEP mutase family enzyme